MTPENPLNAWGETPAKATTKPEVKRSQGFEVGMAILVTVIAAGSLFIFPWATLLLGPFAYGMWIAALETDEKRKAGTKKEVIDVDAAALLDELEQQRTAPRAPSRAIRQAVWERDGGACQECGSQFDIQYDHVIPWSKGGATTVENLQILCAPCNGKKSNKI